MAISQLQYQCLNHVLEELTKMSMSVEVNKLGKNFMAFKVSCGSRLHSACTLAKRKKMRHCSDPLHVQIFRTFG